MEVKHVSAEYSDDEKKAIALLFSSQNGQVVLKALERNTLGRSSLAGQAIDGMDRAFLTAYFTGKSDFVRSLKKVVETQTVNFNPEPAKRTGKVKKAKKK